jgi:hypothetical protein
MLEYVVNNVPSNVKLWELLHNRGATHVKLFFGNDPLGVKTCGESEFDIFEAKNNTITFAKNFWL